MENGVENKGPPEIGWHLTTLGTQASAGAKKKGAGRVHYRHIHVNGWHPIY